MTFRPVTIEDTRVVTHEAATTNSGLIGSSAGSSPDTRVVTHREPVCANCGHVGAAHGRWRCLAADCQCRGFVTHGKTDREVRTFPEAARVIHLRLQEFCDPTLVYPAMIAEASRRASSEIDALRARLATAEAERAYLADRVDALNGQQDGLMQDRRTAEAERDRLLRQIARVRACPCISGASCDELDTLYDLAASPAPSTGTTPP